jgi:hypothetical protein
MLVETSKRRGQPHHSIPQGRLEFRGGTCHRPGGSSQTGRGGVIDALTSQHDCGQGVSQKA